MSGNQGNIKRRRMDGAKPVLSLFKNVSNVDRDRKIKTLT